MCFDALADASSLKRDLVAGLDIMIVRELTGGTYFGEPRGISDLPNGERRGVNTQVYDTHEIVRVARAAFELAQKRNGKLCSVEKANVMESGVLWREEVTKLAADYPDVELSHMYADNCATGSLGMLPSASLGAEDENKKRKAMYEPVHGSAPDIAGQGKANPIACILSYAMALRYSYDMPEAADAVEKAVQDVLAEGYRTGDIMQDGMKLVGTTEMGDTILAKLKKAA